jgi:Zinc carboxypeptidase
MRAWSLAVVVVLFRTAASPALQPVVPTPRDVLGFTPGDDYKLADFNQIRGYFEKLDAASERVIVTSAGKSTEGRDLLVAVISSEANLAQLERYRDISRRLALVRGLTDDEARSLAHEGKAVVWIDNGLHASEVATAQHSLLLGWRVATEESAEMQAIRDNVILVLLPTINPDGLDLVTAWYRRTLGTPYQDSPMPWLYQKYVGHDNNRDFYMQTQEETRVVNRLLYREWLPQILYNQHQGTWPPRMFVPPFPDPFNPNIDPQILRGIDLVGGAMLYRFEREQKDGIVSRYEFSTWYNGSVRTAS